jgi:lysophospholipase L1-like esterase
LSRANRARRVAAAAAFGGGGVGLAAAGGYALLLSQARLARRMVGEPEDEPLHADATFGTGGGEPISFVLLGDSSAVGLGVDSASETPGALLARGLAAAAHRPVTLVTLGHVGGLSSDLAAQVDRALVVAPQLALVMVGANDVTHRVRPSDAVRHLVEAVRRLVEADCAVVVATCPDLGTIEPIAQPLSTVARRWSRMLAAAQTIAVVETGGRTVSIGDLLGPEFAADHRMFSADRFHPSATGYARAAAAMLPSLIDAAGLPHPVDPNRPGDGVLPVAQAAVAAADAAGTEVDGVELGGSARGPRGRWAFLRLRRQQGADDTNRTDSTDHAHDGTDHAHDGTEPQPAAAPAGGGVEPVGGNPDA